MNDAQIRIEDESKPGTGIRELRLKVTTNQRGSTFRWNDYDKRKNYQPYSRPAAFVQDPVSNEAFSREKILAAYPKLRLAVSVPQGEWTLAELLKPPRLNAGN